MNIREDFSVFLHRDFVDFRKSIDGLSCIVGSDFSEDPFQKNLFVFVNRKRDKVKMLYWDRTGYALWYKRLEKGRFKWPKGGKDTVELSREQLEWLLQGIDISKIRPHKELYFQKFQV